MAETINRDKSIIERIISTGQWHGAVRVELPVSTQSIDRGTGKTNETYQ